MSEIRNNDILSVKVKSTILQRHAERIISGNPYNSHPNVDMLTPEGLQQCARLASDYKETIEGLDPNSFHVLPFQTGGNSFGRYALTADQIRIELQKAFENNPKVIFIDSKVDGIKAITETIQGITDLRGRTLVVGSFSNFGGGIQRKGDKWTENWGGANPYDVLGFDKPENLEKIEKIIVEKYGQKKINDYPGSIGYRLSRGENVAPQELVTYARKYLSNSHGAGGIFGSAIRNTGYQKNSGENPNVQSNVDMLQELWFVDYANGKADYYPGELYSRIVAANARLQNFVKKLVSKNPGRLNIPVELHPVYVGSDLFLIGIGAYLLGGQTPQGTLAAYKDSSLFNSNSFGTAENLKIKENQDGSQILKFRGKEFPTPKLNGTNLN